MNRSRHQLFARPCLAKQQHGRIPGSDLFHQFQRVSQRRTVSDNLGKIRFAANLFFGRRSIQLIVALGKLFQCEWFLECKDFGAFIVRREGSSDLTATS